MVGKVAGVLLYYDDWGVGSGGVADRLAKPTVLGVLGLPWLGAS